MNTDRLVSLDVFRGLTIAAMILVNNPGSWDTVYAPLLHAEWHGATPTDLIFPFFVFIVGVAIALAVGRRKLSAAPRGDLVRKILWRALLIFLIGLFLSGYPWFDLATLRIPGVLQRIALVYAITALLFLWLTPRQLLVTGIASLLLYWVLLTLVPIPGGVAPNLEPATNLGAWIDRTLLGSHHLWAVSGTWDPEGLLGTLPALATSISGILTGVWLCAPHDQHKKLAGIMLVGLALTLLGLLWHSVFPINKPLWTSSYVLFTSGVALLTLGAIYWCVDIKGWRRGSGFFVVFGMNALVIYALSGVLARTLLAIRWETAAGTMLTAKGWLWQSVFAPLVPSPYLASLLFALVHVAILFAVAWALYTRRIFIRV